MNWLGAIFILFSQLRGKVKIKAEDGIKSRSQKPGVRSQNIRLKPH
jgi:hypothetical protein